MTDYKIIGIDLAKTKFHIAAINNAHEVIFKKAIKRQDFFEQVSLLFPGTHTFAFEACGGSHYTAQILQQLGHNVILLKPKDVKAFAKLRQKNDINDAIAICKTACDPEIMRVHPKSKEEQEVSYLHKARQNTIQQRIQRSNSIMTSLQEFGYVVQCGKSVFAKESEGFLQDALSKGFISNVVYEQMLVDSQEITQLLERQKQLEKAIIQINYSSPTAQKLKSIPGIGPINASILSIKPMKLYKSAKEFSASLGIVPKQYTTGGNIQLGSITKQGDRYARTMLIQAARTLLIRYSKPEVPHDPIYLFIKNLKKRNKPFNLICVAVANKLARIAYACITQNTTYNPRAIKDFK